MPNNVFVFKNLSVFFKHTDYYGYVHPYNYFEWTSYVRESFFQLMVPGFERILTQSIKMMTAKINEKILFESTFGDVIEAWFTATKVKKVSFDVIVRFYNKRIDKVACETQHTLVFVDSAKNRFSPIPVGIKHAVMAYVEENV